VNRVAIAVPAQRAEMVRVADKQQRSGISVVVCTYDLARLEQLLDCLESVRRQTLPPEKVVVVVDGCPELGETLRRKLKREVVVELLTNQGLSAARNTGAQQVTTPWVAFLDDDAVAEPRWLEELLSSAEQTGAVGAGGWSTPAFDRPAPRWFPPELLWTVGCSYRGMPLKRAVSRNVFGGCAILRTDLFGLVGGYDATLGRRGSDFAGGEEADFCIRVVQAKPDAHFVHVPEAVIHHRVGIERLTRGYVLKRCYADGRKKARITSRAKGTALGPERRYLLRTVPLGMARALATAKPQAAGMLGAAVVAAAVGYVSVVFKRTRPQDQPEARVGRK
jgi:glucosyl-dolichyl phosphate glucuronosyltransferase